MGDERAREMATQARAQAERLRELNIPVPPTGIRAQGAQEDLSLDDWYRRLGLTVR